MATAKAITSKILAKRQNRSQETQTEESGSIEVKLKRVLFELKQYDSNSLCFYILSLIKIFIRAKELLEFKDQSIIEMHREIKDK